MVFVLGSLIPNYLFICKKKKKSIMHIEMFDSVTLNTKFTHEDCTFLCTCATLFVHKSGDFLYLA